MQILQEDYIAIASVMNEVRRVIIGKDDVIRKVMMSMLAKGHILLDDVPGVGKTSLAVAFSRALGLNYSRIQFTPDVLPSDIVGYSMYNRDQNRFFYVPGTVNKTNLLLADEINRTSSRTQAALLEAMEEHQVTVDGVTRSLQDPFLVIATQNQVGTAGTQALPHAQLDRFLVRLSIGYPDRESQMAIITERQRLDPFELVSPVMTKEHLLRLQQAVLETAMHEAVVAYIADLVIASREDEYADLGISPRGAIAISHMAKACALLYGRDYAAIEDVQEVFCDVCAHRILRSQKARAERITEEQILQNILARVPLPYGIA